MCFTFNFYVFSRARDKILMKTGSPSDPVFHSASTTRTALRLMAEMFQLYPLLQRGRQISLDPSYCTENGQKIIQLTLTGYDHIPNFPESPKVVKIQNNRKQSRIYKTHISRGGVDDFWSFDWYRFFSFFSALVSSCYWSG